MEPGQTIGAWTLERKLGEGGMGEVWRAHRVDAPDQAAALKRITGEVDRDRAQRFLREAAILADLDHPGVPRLLDYQSQPMFLAMEYVEGTPVDVLLKERGPLPVPEALELTRQVVDALAFIHARGIWHRDVKPANLVLQPDGWVKLVDFGVARGEGYADLTAAGLVVGMMAYMPPEAFRGAEGEPLAWDLYGAGVVLAKCLTGRSTFEVPGSGVSRQVEQARLKVERPDVDPGEGVPDDVRALVRAMTAQDPERRLTSPGDLGRRLQGLLRSHGQADLGALVAPAAPTAPRRTGRTVWAWLAGAILGLIVLGGLVVVGVVLAAVVAWLALG